MNRLRYFDAWGNPILDRNNMIGYYRDRPKALAIVKSKLPHQYCTIPRVYIDIDPMNMEKVIVVLMYPRKDIYRELHLSARAIQGLRNVYLGKKKGWTHRITKYGHTILEKEGTVILEPTRKYGIYR